MLLHRLTEPRSRNHQWAYVACAIGVLLLALISAADGGIIAGLVYLPVLAVCIVQLWRPTILGWFVLTAAFSAYAICIVAVSKDLTRYDFYFFLSIGLTPAVMLLCSWPRRVV